MEDLSKHLIGTHVIIRSDMSGVHFGTLEGVSGTSVRLSDSRRLYRWSTGGAGLTLSEIAITGIDHSESKISETLPDLVVSGVCEIIPCHGMAIATIRGAATAKP